MNRHLFLLLLLVASSFPAWAGPPPRPADTLRVLQLLSRGVKYQESDAERAQAAIDSALQLARQVRWTKGEARALVHLSNCRVTAADWPGATRYAFEALRLARQLGDARTEAEALARLSVLEYNQINVEADTPRLRAALRWGRECVAVARRLGPLSLASRLSDLGGLLTEAGRYAEADSCLRLAIATLLPLQQHYRLSQAYVNLGFNEVMQGRQKPAVQAMNAAVAEARLLTDSSALPNTLLGRAQIWAKLQRYSPALADARHALRLARQQGQLDMVRMLLILLPDYYEKLQRYPEALAAERRRAAFTDSISSADAKKQVATLNTRYKVAEQQERIQRLTRQREQAEQRAAAQQARLRLLATGVVGLLLALGLFAYFYRQLRRSRARLAASEAELRVANHTKDQLMSIVGHDLRGPMASFQQVGPLLVDLAEQPDPAELRQLGAALTSRARHVGELLDNLLDWARSQTGQVVALLQETPLPPLVAHLQGVFEPLAQAKQVALQTELSADLPSLHTDSNLLRAVLRNLLSNAVKFTPAGGSVGLRLVPTATGYVQVQVHDSGPGLTAEQLQLLRAQGRLRSTRGTAGESGTGLGLLVCYHFVRLLGGELQVQSEPGKGSTWSFELPVEALVSGQTTTAPRAKAGVA